MKSTAEILESLPKHMQENYHNSRQDMQKVADGLSTIPEPINFVIGEAIDHRKKAIEAKYR